MLAPLNYGTPVTLILLHAFILLFSLEAFVLLRLPRNLISHLIPLLHFVLLRLHLELSIHFLPLNSVSPPVFLPSSLSLSPLSLFPPCVFASEMTVNPWLNYNLTFHPDFTPTGFSFKSLRPVVNLLFSRCQLLCVPESHSPPALDVSVSLSCRLTHDVLYSPRLLSRQPASQSIIRRTKEAEFDNKTQSVVRNSTTDGSSSSSEHFSGLSKLIFVWENSAEGPETRSHWTDNHWEVPGTQ